MKFEMDDQEYQTKERFDGSIIGCFDVDGNFERCNKCKDFDSCPMRGGKNEVA